MNTEDNSTTVTSSTTDSMLNRLFGDLLLNVASQPATTRSYRFTADSSWNHAHRNVTSRPVDTNNFTVSEFVTRVAVIACVMLALSLVSAGCYNIHRKCFKGGWKNQQHHKSLSL